MLDQPLRSRFGQRDSVVTGVNAAKRHQGNLEVIRFELLLDFQSFAETSGVFGAGRTVATERMLGFDREDSFATSQSLAQQGVAACLFFLLRPLEFLIGHPGLSFDFFLNNDCHDNSSIFQSVIGTRIKNTPYYHCIILFVKSQ